MKKLIALIMMLVMIASLSVAFAADVPTDIVSSGVLKYDAAKEVNGGNPLTLEFWVQTEMKDYYEKWCAAYTELHPNITFNITLGSYEDHFTKLALALQAGNGPDLFHMHNTFTDQLMPNMKPYDQNVLPLDQLREDFQLIDEHTYDGELYFMGMSINSCGMFYNKAHWAEAGLTDADIPQTWSQFVEVAKKLTKYDENGKVVRAGFSYNDMTMQYLIPTLALQQNRAMFEKDSNVPIIDEQFVQNVIFLRDMYEVEKIGAMEFPMCALGFIEDTASIIYVGTWFGNWMRQNAPGMEYGFFKTPLWDDNPNPAVVERCNSESTPGIAHYVSDEKYAAINDFLLYLLANDNACLDFSLTNYNTPAKKCLSTHELVLADPVLAATGEMMDRLIFPGAVPDPYFTNLATYCWEGVMINGDDPVEAMELYAEETADMLDSTDFVSIESKYAHADEMNFDN